MEPSMSKSWNPYCLHHGTLSVLHIKIEPLQLYQVHHPSAIIVPSSLLLLPVPKLIDMVERFI
jgi:hypothetical protein